jgi:hypothetical protein
MLLFNNSNFKFRFNYELSYVLIPLIYYIYIYLPNTLSYFLYHIVCIGIIGTIDCVYKYNENAIGIGILIISILLHLSLLVVLNHFKKYRKINIISILLLILADIIILFLPYWPYSIKRETLFLLYNFIYVILYILYRFSNTS